MKQRDKIVIAGATVGVVLMGVVVFASSKASAKDGPKTIPKNDGDTTACGPDEVPNPFRATYIAQMRAAKRTPLKAELDKFPACIKRECPPGQLRDRYGRCVESPESPTFCGESQHWDPDAEACVDDGPDACPPGKTWMEALKKCVDVLSPVVPLEPDPPAPIAVYPEGNAFYQVTKNDILGWALSGLHTNAISQNMLARELLLCAIEHGKYSNEAALAFANEHRRNRAATDKIVNEILCGGVNDACYGTWGYCGDAAILSGRCRDTERNHPGAHGRAIRLLRQHADNKLRLEQNLPLARVVDILSPKEKGNGKSRAVRPAMPGGDNSYPLLWLPGVDRKRLWESGGTVVEFVPGQGNPPDFITDRGITDYSGSTLTTYGCAPNVLELA